MSLIPTGFKEPDEPQTRRRFANAGAAWTSRRRVAVALLAPILFVLLVGAAGGWAPTNGPAWIALVALVALAAAATLATYLPQPGAGHRLDLGCTPCAAAAALSVLGAGVVLGTTAHDLSTAGLALVVAGFGLTQRLTNPSTCPTPRTPTSKDF